MTNGGIIEGQRSFLFCCSDLSPATYFPNGSMRVFHGAGTTDEENNAGQQYCTDERRAETQHTATSIWGGYRMVDRKIGHPIAEKEARLRPQHITFGSGDCSFANASESFKGWGADEVAPPRS